MDILISSNLERLLFELCGRDAATVRNWMASLKSSGRFELPEPLLAALQAEFAAGTADDDQTRAAIRRTFEQTGKLVDPHTAVGLSVLSELRDNGLGKTVTLVNATASPYKFVSDVSGALGLAVTGQIFEDARALALRTGTVVPGSISALETMEIRHREVAAPARMGDTVMAFIGKEA